MAYQNWIFTVNNYDDTIEEQMQVFGTLSCRYFTYGREVAPTTLTPHLQGYFILKTRRTFNALKGDLPDRVHIERRLGSHEQAREYAQKDGDVFEVGDEPAGQGSRTDLDAFKAWVVGLPSAPTEREIALEFSSLYLRNSKTLLRLAGFLRPLPIIEERAPRAWQADVLASVDGVADDRQIKFYVDPTGGAGKSWLTRKLLTMRATDTQVFSTGSFRDLAYATRTTTAIFLFDIPRGKMEYLCYDFLEKLKDRVFLSTKYESTMKTMEVTPHVIVFCNEFPDMTRMTHDRYVVLTEFIN